jgi:DHA1 family multidrug resistance protein-like MFS transporter
MPDLRKLSVLILISSLGVFSGSLIAPIEARYIQSITNNSILTGSVLGLGSLFFAVSSIFIGRLSDRVGRKKVIQAGVLLGLLYAIFYSFAINVFQLYGIKFTWAISAAATGPILAAYLQDFLQPFENKGKYFGYAFSIQSIFGSVGAVIGGYASKHFGFTSPFLILASVYLFVFLVATFFLSRGETSETVPKEKQMTTFETLAFVLKKPELLFYLSLNTSFGINWGIKIFLWPLAIYAIAKDDFLTGGIFATMGIVAFLLLPFAGKIVDYYGPFKISFFQFFILGAAGSGLALTDSITWFWVCAAIYTIGEVLNVSQIVLFTNTVPSTIRGAVMGLDAAMDQTLAVAAPFIAGFLIVGFGIKFTLLIFMSLYWISLLVAAFVYWKYKLGSPVEIATVTSP